MKKTALTLMFLLIAASIYPAMGRDYSASAGDWKVSFSTNTPVSTNVGWKESSGMKNGGFYLIWINSSYQVAGITLFELGQNEQAPTTRDWQLKYLQSITSTDLSKLTVSDRKIDDKDGLIARYWDDKLGLIACAACYPFDPAPDNTATAIIEFLSFIGETPSSEIINSIHVTKDSGSMFSRPFAGPTSAYAGPGQGAKTGVEDKNIFNSVSPDALPQNQGGSATYAQQPSQLATQPGNGPFVGSSKSDKYHYTGCSAAQRIKSENLVTFSSSAEARAAGYTPCEICNPP